MNDVLGDDVCVDADGVEHPEHEWAFVPLGESGECPRCGAELSDEDDS